MASVARCTSGVSLIAAACSGDARTDSASDNDAASDTTADSNEGDEGDDEEPVELTQEGEVFEFTVQTGVPGPAALGTQSGVAGRLVYVATSVGF